MRPVARKALACAAIVAAFLTVACSCRERRAASLYEEAQARVAQGDLGSAVGLLERIDRDFPSTSVARKAREDAVLYRGLDEAVRNYPGRRARDLVIRTARAVERFHLRTGNWPTTLADLVPADLPDVPEDPWRHALGYRLKPGNRGYVLACLGADGVPGGTGDAGDLTVEDGAFVENEPGGRR